MVGIHLTMTQRIALYLENVLMTWLVPRSGPGNLLKWFFKTPILFYRLGIPLFNDFLLLLTTRGRRTGKPRSTVLEYRIEPYTGWPLITAGWGGRTAWRMNIMACSHVQVQIGRRRFQAEVEKISEAEVSAWIESAIRINPSSARMFSRWAGESLSLDDPAGLVRAACSFPTYRLRETNS